MRITRSRLHHPAPRDHAGAACRCAKDMRRALKRIGKQHAARCSETMIKILQSIGIGVEVGSWNPRASNTERVLLLHGATPLPSQCPALLLAAARSLCTVSDTVYTHYSLSRFQHDDAFFCRVASNIINLGHLSQSCMRPTRVRKRGGRLAARPPRRGRRRHNSCSEAPVKHLLRKLRYSQTIGI